MLNTLELEKEEITQLVSQETRKNNQDKDNEKVEDEVIKITDPKEFLENFFGSDEYRKAYESYYEGKKPIDVAEEEKRESFNQSENARIAIINFSRNNRIILKYDRDMYSDDFKRHFEDYRHSIKDIRKGTRYLNSQEILERDEYRRYCHSNCADTLIRDGITSSRDLARGLVQLLTIEEGLETFGGAEEDDNERIRRVIGSRIY